MTGFNVSHLVSQVNIHQPRERATRAHIRSMTIGTASAKSVEFHGIKVSRGAKIRNRYNQVPHLAQDTNGRVTNSQLDTRNESQEVSLFPAGDHKAHINRRAQ